MRLVLLAVLSVAALASALPTDVESRRVEIIRPSNDFHYQSFSLTLPPNTVRLITFLFRDDRIIIFDDYVIDSGTGYVRRLDGGYGTNQVTVRAESGPDTMNYRVNVQTMPI